MNCVWVWLEFLFLGLYQNGSVRRMKAPILPGCCIDHAGRITELSNERHQVGALLVEHGRFLEDFDEEDGEIF